MADQDQASVDIAQIDAYNLYYRAQQASLTTTTGSPAGPAVVALGNALAGALATAGTKALLYPLELVTTRLQVQRQLRTGSDTTFDGDTEDVEYASAIDAASKIYRREGGLTAFYVGSAPDVAKGVADSFLFFLAYTFFHRRQLKHNGTGALTVFEELGVGIAAGAFAKLITTPIQNVVTRQQTAALMSTKTPSTTASITKSKRQSIRSIGQQIYDERGVAGFWAGYSASIVLTLNPAITMAVDNLLKRMFTKSRRENMPAFLRFLLAALAKAIATTLTYPAMLAKSRAQAIAPSSVTQAEGTEKDDQRRLPQNALNQSVNGALRLLSGQYRLLLSLRSIYQVEGLTGMYSGIETEVVKGFLSHGLTMTAKDRLGEGVLSLLLYVSARLKERARMKA